MEAVCESCKSSSVKSGQVPVEPLKVKKTGTKDQVWNGEAEQTRGGLRKSDLFECPKSKKIKSIRASEQARMRFTGAKKE